MGFGRRRAIAVQSAGSVRATGPRLIPRIASETVAEASLTVSDTLG
jgi:hypothetical protein